MKILMAHNYYQQPGGEDESFAQEAALLESRGHTVLRYTRHNDDIHSMPALDTAAKTIWNRQTSREMRKLIERERPDVLHCTNTFPLISPAAYYAARRSGVAVVQSLRNFRLLCPGAFLMRDGVPCEACVGSLLPWRAVLHRCYRNSRGASVALTAMLGLHRAAGTWANAVDMYYALTEFGRRKFIEGGLPPEKLAVKPNFLDPDPGPGDGDGGYALFVGRLSPEKGIETLLAAWPRLKTTMPLKILGNGPLHEMVSAAAKQHENISWLGWREADEVSALLGRAAFLVVPSLWYEGFPRTVIESFACGTPVVASRLGALTEVIEAGSTGVHFNAGDAEDMVSTVQSLLDSPDALKSMRSACREEYLCKYTAAANYDQLIAIYQRALAWHGASVNAAQLSAVDV